MKHVTFKHFFTAILAMWMMSSCQKETPVNNSTPAELQAPAAETGKDDGSVSARAASTTAPLAAGTLETNCTLCDPKAKTYDLVETQKSYKFREGANAVSPVGEGFQAVAKVSKGNITQWLIQDKSGKQYVQESQRMVAGGTAWLCFRVPGGIICIRVIVIIVTRR